MWKKYIRQKKKHQKKKIVVVVIETYNLLSNFHQWQMYTSINQFKYCKVSIIYLCLHYFVTLACSWILQEESFVLIFLYLVMTIFPCILIPHDQYNQNFLIYHECSIYVKSTMYMLKIPILMCIGYGVNFVPTNVILCESLGFLSLLGIGSNNR